MPVSWFERAENSLFNSLCMIDADGSEHAVPAGQRRTVFRGKDPLQEPILPMEQMKLEMLREQGSPDVRLE